MNYQFILHLYREGGDCVGTYPLRIDWDRAATAVHWHRIFKGLVPNPTQNPGTYHVEPLWAETGPPHTIGPRIVFHDGGHVDLPLTFFRNAAWQACLEQRQGEVTNEALSFKVSASPNGGEEAPPPEDPWELSVRPEDIPLPLGEPKSLKALIGASKAHPTGPAHDRDMPAVFVPQSVLEDEILLACTKGEAEGQEIGGFLVGSLHSNSDREVHGRMMAVVTGSVSAENTIAREASLCFTHETFINARQALLDRRHRFSPAEICLGWWHLHPSGCRSKKPNGVIDPSGCSPVFMSEADLLLHAVVFPFGFSLVIGKSPHCQEFEYSLFRLPVRGNGPQALLYSEGQVI